MLTNIAGEYTLASFSTNNVHMLYFANLSLLSHTVWPQCSYFSSETKPGCFGFVVVVSNASCPCAHEGRGSDSAFLQQRTLQDRWQCKHATGKLCWQRAHQQLHRVHARPRTNLLGLTSLMKGQSQVALSALHAPASVKQLHSQAACLRSCDMAMS